MNGERCWQKINGPEDESRVADQVKIISQHLEVVLSGVAEHYSPFTLAVYAALMGLASKTFANASVECENSDEHIAEHLDKDIAQFRAHVRDTVRQLRKARVH